MKLIEKIIIKGQLETETGLHIGGSKAALDIGGIDLNVIKTPHGIPFVPGSSLKGKLRSMLAKIEGSLDVEDDEAYIKEIFGSSDDEGYTRLIVRDAPLDENAFNEKFSGVEMDMEYSDVKWENSIDRKTGTAQDPRQLERVPAGTVFDFEMVYDVFDDNKKQDHLVKIRTAMRLLENDYIGGQGSRGYGQIVFKNVKFFKKDINIYHNSNEMEVDDFQY